MNKKIIINKITTLILIMTLSISGMFLAPVTVHAEGWLDYVQDLTLGQAVHGSMKAGDFKGKASVNSVETYWHIYKITMPQTGILNVYLESAEKKYFDAYYQPYFTMYSTVDPDKYIWQYATDGDMHYSAARNMYYGSTQVSLKQGDYYFAVRSYYTLDTPYSLTLSYREPIINVSSISLDKTSLKLTPGDTRIINATALPSNASDKTIYWKSSKSSVASVSDGTVTANSVGTAVIYAISADGEVSASCAVTVAASVVSKPDNTTTANIVKQIKSKRPTITQASSGKKKLAIKFSSVKVKGARYQISYKMKGKKWKTKNVSKTSASISKLISKKKYSVRVRAYITSGGQTYYSKWSKTKTLKIK